LATSGIDGVIHDIKIVFLHLNLVLDLGRDGTVGALLA
jgi:hypothetical protein